MSILVTGGTGYIGSHTIVDLMLNGYDVICIDNQYNSELSVLEGIEKIVGRKPINYSLDLCYEEDLKKVFSAHNIEAIIHFAAYKSVNESVEKPLEYYRNNNSSLLNLLQCSNEFRVNNFIFSSSCSVYGNTSQLPVTESTPIAMAESPYARTKQIGEYMIQDFAMAYPQSQFVMLRYFNPAGAHESALIGESAKNIATNLVPVITETAIGKRAKMTVFGNDYDTRDGSCIRDYIHIMDLADAHTKAFEFLKNRSNEEQVEVFNLGIGEGVSVLEAIRAFEKVSGQKLNYEIGPRRSGDVVSIYADTTRAIEKMGWKANRTIDEIMSSAWSWEQVRRR